MSLHHGDMCWCVILVFQGPEVTITFLTLFIMLINVQMPTIVGILTLA